MNIPLSKRLQACCRYIQSGDRVADIGCDHGYLGIYLLHHKIAATVIAADVNQMPLNSAIGNAGKFGVRDKMQFFLSDGAASIPHDFDVFVCAGMGADTMISILEGAPWLRNSQYRLILQCQSKTAMLRKFLSESGWHISEESVLRDGRFLYTVMHVLWQPDGPKLTAGQHHFSPALLRSGDPDLATYYQQVVFRLQRAVDGQKEQADPCLVTALSQLRAMAQQYPQLKENTDGNRK